MNRTNWSTLRCPRAGAVAAKFRSQPNNVPPSNLQINEWYDHAMANGALGGKLIGAGGGGFLMFYAHDKTKLRHAMRETGMTEVRFRFDFEGTKVVIQ